MSDAIRIEQLSYLVKALLFVIIVISLQKMLFVIFPGLRKDT